MDVVAVDADDPTVDPAERQDLVAHTDVPVGRLLLAEPLLTRSDEEEVDHREYGDDHEEREIGPG